MRSEEKKTSRHFTKKLRLLSIEDYVSKNGYKGKKYKFRDGDGMPYYHYQLLPVYCKGKGIGLAAKFIASAKEVGALYSCSCITRLMSNGTTYYDVDAIKSKI